MKARHIRRAAELIKLAPESQRWPLAQFFAALAEEFNPLFDRARFFITCGLESDHE